MAAFVSACILLPQCLHVYLFPFLEALSIVLHTEHFRLLPASIAHIHELNFYAILLALVTELELKVGV